MRTYKDTKAMAKSLRESLAARSVLLSHSECLEIVAKLAGFTDWNTLSAKLDVGSGQLPAPKIVATHNQPYSLEPATCPEPLGRSRCLVHSAVSRSTKCAASLKEGAATEGYHRAFLSAMNA